MNYITKLEESDCRTIQLLLTEWGVEATLGECRDFWEWASEDWSASWLATTQDLILHRFADYCIAFRPFDNSWGPAYEILDYLEQLKRDE